VMAFPSWVKIRHGKNTENTSCNTSIHVPHKRASAVIMRLARETRTTDRPWNWSPRICSKEEYWSCGAARDQLSCLHEIMITLLSKRREGAGSMLM
jgi:hypothetical protein